MDILVIQSDSKETTDLVTKLATKLGAKVETSHLEDDLHILSEPSLAEAWLSDEDKRWDDLLK